MTAPSLEEIREIQRIEAEKISEAIRSGNIEGIRVSDGAFGRSFDHLSKGDLRDYAKKRLDDLNKKSKKESEMDVENFEVGLKTFNRICESWGLSDSDRLQLLGSGSKENQLIHISYVLGIYKNLHTLFENAAQADNWIHKPNRDFEGRPALHLMLEDDLKRVRSYLDYMVSN